MNKFISRLFLFFGFPIVIVILFEAFIYTNKTSLFTENSLSGIFNGVESEYKWIEQLPNDTIISLAGSSTVRYGLSCLQLNNLSANTYSFVNIAMDARDPIETYFILKKLQLKKVKIIYFALDPWIYSKRYYSNRRDYFYLDFSLSELFNYTIDQDKTAFIKRYKSLLISFIPFSENKKINKTAPVNFGSAVLDRNPINFNRQIDNWFELEKYSWSDLQFEYLKKISDLCSENEIRLFFFLTPKRSDFTNAYIELCSVEHEQFIIKLLQHEISELIFGKLDQLSSVCDGSCFAESFHLNKEGQKMYTELFYQAINDSTQWNPLYKHQWILDFSGL